MLILQLKRFLGYDVEQATYTETFDGNEQQDLFLRHVPIASITSVTEDGNTLTQGNTKMIMCIMITED